MKSGILIQPLWEELRPYVVVQRVPQDRKGRRERVRIELRNAPSHLMKAALRLVVPCPACGEGYLPFRMRHAPPKRGPETFRGVYFAATCPLSVRLSCSRGLAASTVYEDVRDDIEAYQESLKKAGL